MMIKLSTTAVLSALLMLTACAGGEARYPTGYDRTETHQNIYAKRDSIMGDHGFCVGGSDQRAYQSEGAPEIFSKAKVSLASAVRTAEASTKGRAFDAGINRYSNTPAYVVKTLHNGKVSTVWVSAKTGAILN